MKKDFNRRKFLSRTLISATLGSIAVNLKLGAQSDPRPLSLDLPISEPKGTDPLDKGMVFEFVRICHGNLDRATELLETEPKLIYASWDWGIFKISLITVRLLSSFTITYPGDRRSQSAFAAADPIL